MNKKDHNKCISEPWKKRFYAMRSRCLNPAVVGFERYGGRGIKCLMTLAEMKFLWFRDKAYTMKMPSIDRINNDGNYELSNCQFIERGFNAIKDRFIPVRQLTMGGKLVAEYPSAKEAAKKLRCDGSYLLKCARRSDRTYGGFKWEII